MIIKINKEERIVERKGNKKQYNFFNLLVYYFNNFKHKINLAQLMYVCNNISFIYFIDTR